jgi:hypothetical protein
MDAKAIFEQFQDHLALLLDTYEQAIYLYILRHGRLQGVEEIVIGFKSARRRIATGIGEKGKPISEGTCYEKLRALQSKGFIEIVGTERGGTRIRLRLPSEIDGVIPADETSEERDIETMDFSGDPLNRLAILHRDSNRCFYCLRLVDSSNYVIEHLISRPLGNNSYRNVVASCIGCNNRKSDTPVEQFLRQLYREGFLSKLEFEDRTHALQRLQAGEMNPTFP